MSQDHYLIVDKQFEGDRPLDDLFATLFSDFELDGYTARQRLLGRGPALLAEGPKERLMAMGKLLKGHAVKHWLLVPTPPHFDPERILGLTVTDATLSFHTRQKNVVLQRGDTAVAVLADLSGRVREKSLKRLLIQSTYRGAKHIRPMNDDELIAAILRAEPVLDLYIFSPKKTLRGAVRVLPETFNITGLAEGATYRGIANFEKLFQSVEDYAGELILQPDFGLAPLAGCRLKISTDGVNRQSENFSNLTRFGWLMVDIWRAETTISAEPGPETTESPLATLHALGLTENLLADSPQPELSGRKTSTSPAKDDGLPLPPLYTGPTPFPWRRALVLGGGASLLFSASATLRGVRTVLSLVWFQGVGTGLLPAAFALGLLWGGFFFLRLKRQVENTPTSKARSMAMGMVEVHGRAVRQYALVSPMTQLPCVYYRVRKFRQNGGGTWRLAGELESGHVPFYLEDETGRVSVDPRGAAIKARTQRSGHASGMEAMFGTAGSLSSDEKWVEETIPEGTSLYVLGHASPRHHQQPSLRDRTIAALRDLKFNPQELRKYDSDGDGRISQPEWEGARAQVEKEILHQTLAEKGPAPQEGRIVIGRAPARALPFIIAETESEAHLTRNYHLFTLPLFTAGGAMALWAAFKIFTLFGIR
jgi:hypothetical protein